MAKKNKLWFSGEDAQLAARFTKCLTKALYNRRASYLRAKAEQAASEISIEECSEEVDKMYTPTTRPVEEIVESKLMWESIRKYLHTHRGDALKASAVLPTMWYRKWELFPAAGPVVRPYIRGVVSNRV